LANEITINFIWVERNNSWQIPENWDPHDFDYSVSENLNEVAEHWDMGQNLEFIFKKFIAPPVFLKNPEFDTTYLHLMFKEGVGAAETIEMLPPNWVRLSKMLQSAELEPSVIAVPHDMNPWEWYALNEDEKLSQMGLGESDSMRSDGVLYSEFNSFYFDTYRPGSISFELTESIELKDIVTNPQFITYSKEVIDRGPDSLFHTVCDENCAFRPCSRMEIFPASISLWR
jgi:hypothetical protein